jgi:hypothetical protein
MKLGYEADTLELALAPGDVPECREVSVPRKDLPQPHPLFTPLAWLACALSGAAF